PPYTPTLFPYTTLFRSKTPVFVIQALTFSFFFLYTTKLCFYDFIPSFVSYQRVRFPFALICVFVAYVFTQWLGGQLVFLKFIPRSEEHTSELQSRSDLV